MPETNQVATSYVYNGFGLVTQRTDARGVVTTFSYDSLNPTIAFNPNNYWQATFGDFLGTLVHEYAHLANPGTSGTDEALIKALGIANATNANDISKKFAKDCFPGAKP
jgi:YD repeat-containing protein